MPAARSARRAGDRSRGTRRRSSAPRSTRTRSRASCGSRDALFEAGGSRLGRVLILGGWVGVLGAVLLHDPPLRDRQRGQHRHRSALRPDRARAQRDACARRPLRRRDRRHARHRLRGARAVLRRSRRSRHQHELRAPGRFRSLVCADPAGPAAGPAVERLFRLRRARQLRADLAAFRAQAPMRDVHVRRPERRCAATFASC